MKNGKRYYLVVLDFLWLVLLLVTCGSSSSKNSSSNSKTLKLWVPTGAKKSYSDTVA